MTIGQTEARERLRAFLLDMAALQPYADLAGQDPDREPFRQAFALARSHALEAARGYISAFTLAELGPTEFDVLLRDVGPSRLNTATTVKFLTGWGLKETHDFLDSVPAVVKSRVTRGEADAVAAQLIEAGATVEVYTSAAL